MPFLYTRQKWTNILLCFLMIFVCLGFCSSSKSLFLPAICDALEVKRTVFSLSSSCRFITTSIVNIFFGTLVARFGTRKLIITGFFFLITAMLLNSIASHVILFMISEVFSGIGFSLSGTAIVGCVVNRWSPRNKGTLMGAILCANGVGGAVCAQIITPMIYTDDPFGYRNAYRFIALVLLLLCVAMLLFFREKPKDPPASGSSVKKSQEQDWIGVDFSVVVRQSCFFGALICIFFTGFCLQGITGISAAHMRDVGLEPTFIAAMSSLSMLILTGSKFLTGFLRDRLGLRWTVTLCSAAAVLCMIFLSAISVSSAGRCMAILYAILASVALPLETVMLPLYAADLFGSRNFDRIMGLFISVNTAGYALGTPLVNLGYDLTGSYKTVLLLTALIMLLVTIGIQFVISAAHRLRNHF